MIVSACLVMFFGARVALTYARSDKQSAPRAAQTASGWLGMALSCTGCDGGTDTGPLVVRAVTPGGPAERFLAVGDTIVSVNRTITDPRRMREALLATPHDSLISFEMRGSGGNYSVALRKRPDRMTRVGRDSLPLKYQGAFRGIGVEVLTGAAPIINRDSSGAMVIRIGEHVVRLNPSADTVK
jgi:hypothetical protein